MKRLMVLSLLLFGPSLTLMPARATNSPIELRDVLGKLMKWLPGEFDSEPQRFFEDEYKTPIELQHGRVYRSFTRIDAPQIGEHVLVAQVRYGGKEGRFDDGEFLVWTLAVDLARAAVRMTPRRFVEPGRYRDAARDAARFTDLSSAELAQAGGPAGCEILWRLSGAQLRGANVPGACRGESSAARASLIWDWEFILNAEELWINFAGRDAAGRLVVGRPDQTHWRLGKARDFECFLTYTPEGAERQAFVGFTMHDRGDVHRLALHDANGMRPVFMQLQRGMWPSNSGRNYVDLLRLQVYEGRPEDGPERWRLIGSATGSAATDRAGFATPTLSGRCKLLR